MSEAIQARGQVIEHLREVIRRCAQHHVETVTRLTGDYRLPDAQSMDYELMLTLLDELERL